ncbi:NAD(P)-binding protein [Pseudovirgaria hyperparasitica]|uniref:NAD(P)-binding protein n=1 Tax=Pseudovirgaria hyperparasitica TaxID=470096 RepID=A0A6A6W182_9PEZI|nr:NAD(P)-binding protein [Pseudovirgaria hyperparasitica]KAF2755734.1 NAD(P)-binding protein [Pseudovirgaria hyperparasitica]
MSAIKNVILLGAAGDLGKYIYAALVDADFDVTVISRPESNSIYPASARVIKTEYSLEGLTEAFRGHDAVVSSIAVPAAFAQFVMIDAAIAAGVKRFIPSYFGYAVDKTPLPEMEPFSAPKTEVLKYLEDRVVATAEPGLTYSSVACGVFIDWAMKKFPVIGGYQKERRMNIFDSGNATFTGTTMEGIATSVAGILKNPGPTANRHVKVRSIQTSQNEIVAAFEKVTGHEWTKTYLDSEETYAVAKEKLKVNDRSAILDLLSVVLFRDGGGQGIVASREASDNEMVGLQEEDIETIVRRVLNPNELPM